MQRTFWCLCGLIAAFATPLPFAYAGAEMARTQVPGYYRLQLGTFEVTALYDGSLGADVKVLKNTTPAELEHLLSRMFVGYPEVQTAVNAYLVNTGTNLVLVDAGAAKLYGPTLGFVVQNLKAAGYNPAQVDTVVITHLHADHVGGLNDASGQPVFPNATILSPQADNDYWLSQEIADRSPTEMRASFKMMRDAAAPYLATGKWRSFAPDSVLVPGIRAVEANGHTPGHTAYAIESKGENLLIWGDVVHAHAVQFANPGVSIEWDTDQEQAIVTRRKLMDMMAKSKSLVAGMHLPFPGIGHVRADGKDRYSWIPIEFAPMPSPSPAAGQ